MVGHKQIFLNFVCGIIFDKDGSILLQKRRDTKKWGLPGGAMELDESVETTVIREVLEETGLKIKVDKFLGIYSDKKYFVTYSNTDKCQPIVTAFYAKVLGGTLKPSKDRETLELGYFQKNKLPQITNQQHLDMKTTPFLGKLESGSNTR